MIVDETVDLVRIVFTVYHSGSNEISRIGKVVLVVNEPFGQVEIRTDWMQESLEVLNSYTEQASRVVNEIELKLLDLTQFIINHLKQVSQRRSGIGVGHRIPVGYFQIKVV